jgi:carbon-monoxide dehydrogenase medium subunit
MRPPPFQYTRPETIEDAIALLARHGDKARVLAGGQSLVPLLNFRLSHPDYLIDIGRLSQLDFIRAVAGGIEIGAMTRLRSVERSEIVRQHCPLLHEAIGHVGHGSIRNRATIGGSVAHADPAAELPAVVAAIGAELRLRGPAGERSLSAGDFFQGYLATAIAPDELLVSVLMPTWPPGSGSCFREFCRRQGDFAIVGAASIINLAADGTVGRVGLALSGIGGRPFDGSAAVTTLLQGKVPDESALAGAAVHVSSLVEPDSDIHAPAEYRRHLAGVLTRRALAGAVSRAVPRPEEE